MTLNRRTLFQLFKYLIYSLLALNVYLFWREEYLAGLVEFPGGVPVLDWINAYVATIDTASWLILLLMFELETYVLEDRHFTPPVTLALHGIRILCYVFIVYAFYGYLVNVAGVFHVEAMPGLADLCALAGDGWSYAVDFDEYVSITAGNCSEFPMGDGVVRFLSHASVVSTDGLRHIQLLALADAVNGLVWILVVVVLEIEVRLQERDKLGDRAVRILGALKILLYSALFVVAVYWGFDGDFVDFWDAFLWLVAFFFIEMNVIEWRAEEEDEAAAATATAAR